jgi:crossover junction endodeoxyribonuclease RusA
MTVTFFVPGTPAPKGSKRHVGNGVLIESSKLLGPWQNKVTWFAAQAMKRHRAAPFTSAVGVTLAFVMPRPKSAPKTKVLPAIKRPDIDKMCRGVLDGLTKGVIYLDDSQVVDLKASKRLALPGEQPGCQITISEAE